MQTVRKIMNNEIKKYQGRIYYFDTDVKKILPAEWIFSTADYDHFSFELHHVIKFSKYEREKQWFRSRGLEMCLVLIPKVMHQHLENPVYGLPDHIFFEKYGVAKFDLLFDNKDFAKGFFPKILRCENMIVNFDDVDISCFDNIYSEVYDA